VQIARLAMHDDAATRGIKNIKLTDNIHLFGHYCAYHPNKTGFYKSPEIPIPLVNAIKAIEHATFRHTVMDEACLEKAYIEFDSLKNSFEILRHFQKVGLVHKALSPLGRMIRDLPKDTDIVVEEPALAARYKPILNTLRPDLNSRMHIARENEKPLITFLGIEDVWHSLLSPRVECPNGISIHIYEAPAATLIDVNSGPRRSDETNSIAAKCIIEQIKWRQLGGAILVDFVDSHSRRERKKLEDYLKKLAQEFKIESLSILGWSHLGLYELSHPRRGESLTRILAGLKD
jgi:Rne/Rng family ribonuclease